MPSPASSSGTPRRIPLRSRAVGMRTGSGSPSDVWSHGSAPTIAESSIEAALFGQKRTAADGTSAVKPGRFAEAHGGTLLIEEIGELSRAM